MMTIDNIPRKVMIGNGKGTKKPYYLYEEINNRDKAKEMAIEIKEEYKCKGQNIKTFIIPFNDKIYGLYLTKECNKW